MRIIYGEKRSAMTVKEASKHFGKTEREIRQAIKDGLLQARKEHGKYLISDKTEIIVLKSEVKMFLIEILKYKNNQKTSLNRSLCPTPEELKVLANYLYYQGFVGEYKECSEAKEFFQNVQLTDKGFLYAVGEKSLKSNFNFPLAIKPEFNFSLLNLSLGAV